MSQTRFMFLLVLELSDFLFFLFLNRHFETATHCTLQPKYLMFFNIFTNKKHHFVKRKTNVPKRFVFFSVVPLGLELGFFLWVEVGFFFLYFGMALFVGAGPPFLCRILLGRPFCTWGWPPFLGVGLPSPGWDGPSFLGLVSLAFLLWRDFGQGLACLLALGVRLPSPTWGSSSFFL